MFKLKSEEVPDPVPLEATGGRDIDFPSNWIKPYNLPPPLFLQEIGKEHFNELCCRYETNCFYFNFQADFQLSSPYKWAVQNNLFLWYC